MLVGYFRNDTYYPGVFGLMCKHAKHMNRAYLSKSSAGFNEINTIMDGRVRKGWPKDPYPIDVY